MCLCDLSLELSSALPIVVSSCTNTTKPQNSDLVRSSVGSTLRHGGTPQVHRKRVLPLNVEDLILPYLGTGTDPHARQSMIVYWIFFPTLTKLLTIHLISLWGIIPCRDRRIERDSQRGACVSNGHPQNKQARRKARIFFHLHIYKNL